MKPRRPLSEVVEALKLAVPGRGRIEPPTRETWAAFVRHFRACGECDEHGALCIVGGELYADAYGCRCCYHYRVCEDAAEGDCLESSCAMCSPNEDDDDDEAVYCTVHPSHELTDEGVCPLCAVLG